MNLLDKIGISLSLRQSSAWRRLVGKKTLEVFRLLIVVVQSCPALCDPMDYSTSGFPVLHFLKLMCLFKLRTIKSVMPSNHLILHHPLLLFPSIFSSIRVFSNESALHIRWLKYWSFSFSTSLSNEYSGLISLRIGWFDLAVRGTLKSLRVAVMV